jgi:hypothetical protein
MFYVCTIEWPNKKNVYRYTSSKLGHSLGYLTTVAPWQLPAEQLSWKPISLPMSCSGQSLHFFSCTFKNWHLKSFVKLNFYYLCNSHLFAYILNTIQNLLIILIIGIKVISHYCQNQHCDDTRQTQNHQCLIVVVYCNTCLVLPMILEVLRIPNDTNPDQVVCNLYQLKHVLKCLVMSVTLNYIRPRTSNLSYL